MDGQIKLSDFGMASRIKKEKSKTVVGSPCWMAPEIL